MNRLGNALINLGLITIGCALVLGGTIAGAIGAGIR